MAKLNTGKSSDVMRAKLRSLPIDLRAQFIVEIFQIIASEFAAMVLEHVASEGRGRMRNAALKGWATRRRKRRSTRAKR